MCVCVSVQCCQPTKTNRTHVDIFDKHYSLSQRNERKKRIPKLSIVKAKQVYSFIFNINYKCYKFRVGELELCFLVGWAAVATSSVSLMLRQFLLPVWSAKENQKQKQMLFTIVSAALFCALKPMDTTFMHMHVLVHVHVYMNMCIEYMYTSFVLSQFCFYRVLHLFICMAICKILFIYKSIALEMCMYVFGYVYIPEWCVCVCTCAACTKILKRVFFFVYNNKTNTLAKRR